MQLKVAFLVFICSLQSIVLVAQSPGYNYGFLYNNSNDTIEGYIKHINNVPYKILVKVKYKESLEESQQSV